MFGLQETLDAMMQMQMQRKADLAESEQLVLGEIISKLEAISDKSKPVFFDFNEYSPGYTESWRGSYCEIGLNYFQAETPPTVEQVLTELRGTIGCTFEGYKGGDFKMSRHTPVWVANYSESGVFGYKGSDDYQSVAIVDVQDGDNAVLQTKAIDY